MKKIKTFMLMILIFFLNERITFGNIEISVIVEDTIITNYDLEKEMNYLQLLNSNFSKLSKNQKLNIAKNYLIDQIVKTKELNKLNFKFNSEKLPIDNFLKNIISKLDLLNEMEFKVLLEKNQSYNIDEIKEKIKLEILWNNLIYNKYLDQVKIDKKEILERVNNLEETFKKEYSLYEILFLKKKNQKVEDLFKEIMTSINEIGFNNTANIYSISKSSKFGGKIGWVDEVGLSKKIKDELKKIKIGDYTDVIELGNNYLILKVDDVRTIKYEINKEKELERIINLETNNQLEKFSKIYFNKSKLNYSINEK